MSKKDSLRTYAIHLDAGNPHVHIQATTRPWEEGTFSKRRYVLEREQLVEIRHLAADVANEFAKEKGYNYVLDARSYADQGLKILPTRHMGPKAYHKYKEDSRIGRENEDIDRQNLLSLFHHPEEIIKLVATQKVVFSRYDSISSLERDAGLKANAVRNILRGISKKPTAVTLQAIANVMGCTVESLLDGQIDVYKTKMRPSPQKEQVFESPEMLESCLQMIIKIMRENEQTLSLQQILFVIGEVYAYSVAKEPPKIDKDFVEWIIKRTLE